MLMGYQALHGDPVVEIAAFGTARLRAHPDLRRASLPGFATRMLTVPVGVVGVLR